MSRMIFDLTDDDRAALEAHRVKIGARSNAEALRSLIRGKSWVSPFAEDREFAVASAEAPLTIKPLPRALTSEKGGKPEPFKTRLKGEWKAP